MSPRRFSPCRRLALMTVLLASACLIRCAGATRMPVRSRGLPAAQVQTSKVDNGFVESMSDQQKETADKLASIDTATGIHIGSGGAGTNQKQAILGGQFPMLWAEEPTYLQHMETPNTAGI